MADNHAEIEEIESIDDRIKAENMETNIDHNLMNSMVR